MPGHRIRFFEFGPFSIDVSSRVLLRDGKPLPLEPKVFDTLLVLVANHGRVVSKEELMNAVWGPDTFVEEGGLARNISQLRKTLANGFGDTQLIATYPKRGYQFVAPVSEVTEGGQPEPSAAAHTSVAAPAVVETPSWHGHLGRAHGQDARATAGETPALRTQPAAAFAMFAAVLMLALGYWFVRPLPAPVVFGYRRLTQDGRQKRSLLLTDGPRLYFEEVVDGKWVLAVMPSAGGEVSTFPLPSPSVWISDIAADGTDLIGWEQAPGSAGARLLVWRVANGTPESLAGLRGMEPTWSPDGARVAYSDGIHSLFLAGRHGESPQRVTSVEGLLQAPRWTPDGRFLLFLELDAGDRWSRWEIPVSGGQPRPFPNRGENPSSIPVWVAGGSYSIFPTGPEAASELWARRENCGPLRWKCREPVRINASPVKGDSLLPSRDGKHLFLISGHSTQELQRYDLKSKTFAPYLPAIRAGDVDFSKDGKWITFARPPERALWRCRLDGSNAAPLTDSGAGVYSPHWSPDGKQIAYMSISAQDHFKACVVSVDGGSPREVVAGAGEEGVPTWSPDGNFLVFGDTLHVGHAAQMAIHLLNLRDRQLSTLPGSAGLWNPRWSPDGRYIAALALGDETKGQLSNCASLLLYSPSTRRWTTLAHVWNITSLVWSRSSQYVYFLAEPSGRQMYRVSVATKRVEPLADFAVLSGGVAGDWIGMAPDGSPVVMSNARIEDVYALDVQWP